MRNIFLFVFYILGFTLASLLISQLHAIMNGDKLFSREEDVILSVVAGVASGLIVGFFNSGRSKDQ
jgi:hypothetical protein